jgi:thiamine-phosphate pyrophosphorylase
MLPESTPAVERALEYARRLAQSAGADAVQPLHLLHGLLQEEEGRAAQVAVQAGLDWQAYKTIHPAPTDGEAVGGGFPVQRATRNAMVCARELAFDLEGEALVASESLLLSMLRTDEPSRRTLEALGLSLPRLEEAVYALHKMPLPREKPEPRPGIDPTGQIDAARILDACANRAREGLRVVEDYCRFVLDDAFLCGELKRLRHDLTEALADLPTGTLLAGRETQRDVGTALSTPGEGDRPSLTAVALANWKRLQEALRSLEEFGKTIRGELGAKLEQLRYRSYTLERAAVLGAAARERLAEVPLCVLLTGSACKAGLERTIAEAAAGGAGMVQLREKDLSDRELLERARQVRAWTRTAGVLFIVNDRPDVARLVEADGVHLGQDDMAVKDARHVLGPNALIGVSTHNLEQVRQAVLDGAGYIGVGPTFPSRTKTFAAFPGLDFVRQVAAETTLPAFVIGGVNGDTIAAAVAAGARRVAVSQAVAEADDPRGAAAELVRVLTSG